MHAALKSMPDARGPIPDVSRILLQRIADWDLSGVRQYIRDRHPCACADADECLDRRIRGLRLLYAGVVLGLSRIAVSPDVLVVLEAHIVQTEDYGLFCDQVFGGYLHLRRQGITQAQRALQAATLRHLRRYFGDDAAADFGVFSGIYTAGQSYLAIFRSAALHPIHRAGTQRHS